MLESKSVMQIFFFLNDSTCTSTCACFIRNKMEMKKKKQPKIVCSEYCVDYIVLEFFKKQDIEEKPNF